MVIKDILTPETITYIEQALCMGKGRKNQGSKIWSAGPLTGNRENKKFKSNKEYIGPCYRTICEKVWKDVESNMTWRKYITAPKSSTPPLILKYEKGDHYKPHTDISKGYDNIALHYTNILFLNDPKEYGGGELMVDIYGSSLPFKLEKNSILTYPTGLKHSVNPITRGKRYSLIWWSDSFISNEEDRVTLRTLEKLLMGVHEYMRDELSLEGNSTASHPLGEIGVHCNTIAERIHSKYPRSRDPQCYLITE